MSVGDRRINQLISHGAYDTTVRISSPFLAKARLGAKLKPTIVILLTAGVLFLSACSFVPPKALSVDNSYAGKEVRLAQYGSLTITLESDPATGYIWSEKAMIADATVVEQTAHSYVPPDISQPGANGHEIWTFNALTAGQSTIYLEYRLPSEPSGSPFRSFRLELTVTPEG